MRRDAVVNMVHRVTGLMVPVSAPVGGWEGFVTNLVPRGTGVTTVLYLVIV